MPKLEGEAEFLLCLGNLPRPSQWDLKLDIRREIGTGWEVAKQ